MPRKAKVITDFSNYEDGDLSSKAHTGAAMLTTNAATFPGLPVAGPALEVLALAFDTTRNAPVYPSKTADTDAARTALLAALSADGIEINVTADGDPVILALSGFPLAKEPGAQGVLQQTAMVVTSAIGSFDVKITPTINVDEHKTVIGARNYIVACIEVIAGVPIDPDPHKWPWFYFPNSSASLTGLKSSTKYRLASTALGTSPTLVFSFPIERTTQ